MTLTPQDFRFLELCELAKKHSHDPIRPVGAVLVSAGGDIISTGTNRPPFETQISYAGSQAAFRADPEMRYFLLEHAERDAVAVANRSGRSTRGATAYSTLFPCADCARALIAAGIRRLVAPLPSYSTDANKKWELHFIYAKELLGLANVELDLFVPEVSNPIATRKKA